MKKITNRILYKLISQDISTQTRFRILESFDKVWPWNKLKGLVLSVIRLKSYINFFIWKVLQVLYFPWKLKNKIWKRDFWEYCFQFLCFQSFGTMTRFFFKSRVENETWLDKLTEVSNYGKFICNNLDWGTVKIGIIGTKVQFSVWIWNDGLFKSFFICVGMVKKQSPRPVLWKRCS